MTGFGDLNLKLPLILTISKIYTISVFMSNLNFMLSSFGHEKMLYNLGSRALYASTSVTCTR